jgi:menaquinone-dependent protoporphyrinogen oxidase
MTGGAPRVLVTAASRHGATQEIARAIAARLDESPSGLAVMAVPVEQNPDPLPFAAVVLGSAVYMGRWLEPARTWASAHAAALRVRPLWIFSSGPIGDPPFPPDEPHDAAPLLRLTGAREHRVFAGRLDKARLSFGERAMVTAMRAPLGDFRDWDAVRSWADAIGAELAGPPAPVAGGPVGAQRG